MDLEQLKISLRLDFSLQSEAESGVHDGEQVDREEHAEHAQWLQVQVSRIVERVGHPQSGVAYLVHCILLLNYDGGSSEVVQSAKVLSSVDGFWLNGSYQFEFDVLSALWQNDLDLIVLSERLIIGMHEINFKSVLQRVFFALKQVVLGRHMVALVPVSLPLAKNREPWLDAEGHMIGLPLGIARADIPDVVVVVQPRNVNWK